MCSIYSADSIFGPCDWTSADTFFFVYKMKWTFLILCTCLFGMNLLVKCHPLVSSSIDDDDYDDYYDSSGGGGSSGNESIRELGNTPNNNTAPPPPPRITRKAIATNLTRENEATRRSDDEDLFTSDANHHDNRYQERMLHEGSNPFVNVLKALNLPTSFAESRSSSSSDTPTPMSTSTSVSPGAIASFIQAITPSALSITPSLSTSASSSAETSTSGTTSPSPLPLPVTLTQTTVGSGDGPPVIELDPTMANPAPALKYMTGNAMLDKIMNCPCAKEQLSAVGVRGVAYFNNPDPAIFRDPPYGPDAQGPGDHISANLKNVGGTTGNVFGQVIRLILGIPIQAVSLLKPLVTGIADTWSATTEAAAEVAGQKAKQIPTVLRSTAVVIKKLLETVGDVTGTLLHVFANIIASVAAAKSSVAGTLPFAFDGIGDMLKGLGSQVGSAVDLVSGTSEIISGGVINAAKTTGNLVVGLVEGSKGFQAGLLEGIKYGINDEKQPGIGENGQGWRR